MATIMAKEAGVPHILAKAKNEIYAKVLRKVGADEIVFPEVAMGQRIAKGIMTGKFIDLLELSSKFSITEFKVFDSWIGKTFRELNLRERYGVNMIARKVGEEIEMDLIRIHRWRREPSISWQAAINRWKNVWKRKPHLRIRTDKAI